MVIKEFEVIFVFEFQKCFLKNFNFFYFLLYFKLIFFDVFRLFYCTDIKNNLKKTKKILF